MPISYLPSRWQTWKKRIIEWLSILLLVALIIVPITILGWLMFFTDTFVVQAVTVVDAREHTTESIRGIVEPFIGKKILFIQTDILEQQVRSDIPQIRSVYIVRKLPGTLKVIAQEKTPALLLLSNKKYHFVDEEGIPYEEARLETLPGVVLPVVKNNDAAATVLLGAPALDESFVTFVRKAQDELPDIIDAQVAEIRIPSLAAREVHFLLDNNWVIRFDTTRPLESQLNVLQRLLEHTIPQEDQKNIDYIDLRIQNRVYYKLRSTQHVRQP